MRSVHFLLAAATFASVVLLWSLMPSGVEAKDEWWLKDYQAARKASKKTGKPILLVFR